MLYTKFHVINLLFPMVILVMRHKSFVLTFIPLSHEGATWKIASIDLAVSKEKKFENAESDQDKWMTLTFDIHNGLCSYLVNCIYQLWYHRL